MARNILKNGFLTIDDQQQEARKRLIAALAVAVVTFILGVALVAALKSPLDYSETPPPGGGGDDGVATAATAAPAGPDTVSPKTKEPEPVEVAKDDTLEAPPPTGDDAADDDADDTDDTDDTDDAADDDDVAADDDADDADDDATPPAKVGPWWEQVKGKRCKLKFGEHARLIMREGHLNRDETTTYGPFAKNEIALRVRKEHDPIIIPRHFGFHPRNNEPCLVHATVIQGDQEVTGILPLKIGDDLLTLAETSE